ncbi:histidinol-phosphate transaminase [Pseudochrobactrum sp. MP213Fo]|uniref:histidinol-phosphate transaminase n=1 Tax=Pseudochrobactrum sp. MP213Fo TaxID=3022250 RepID=UPI003BA16D7A
MNDFEKAQRPTPKAGVMDIAAYVPGKATLGGANKVHKLSANESPLGASPHAVEAYRTTEHYLSSYPDGEVMALRQAIAETQGLNIENILCGNGSDELLGLLCQTYLAAGDEAVFTDHGFLIYKIQTLAAGAKPVIVKENDTVIDVDAVLAAITDRTKIVFVTNPGNPTGTYLPFAEINRLHAGLPKHVLLVLDAAYAEYVRKNDYEAGVALVSSSDNVVMTRTFSKIHGLPALRIGWMYAPAHVTDAVNRVRGPFNMNSAAIAAGAAAIRDRNHVQASVEFNTQWSQWLSEAFTKLGLKVTPSVTNFLLVHFPDTANKSAAKADEYLQSKGYILRRVTSYGFPEALRMSIGSEEANRGVIAALEEFLKS